MSNSVVLKFWRNAGSEWLDFLDKNQQGIPDTAARPCGHQWWLDVSVELEVSTSKQTGDDDVRVLQPSIEVSQQGMMVQYHEGNDDLTNKTMADSCFTWDIAKREEASQLQFGKYVRLKRWYNVWHSMGMINKLFVELNTLRNNAKMKIKTVQ